MGSVRPVVAGSVIHLPRQLSRLLAALVLDSPRTVADDVLIDRLWGDEPPPTARASLQVFVGRLRRTLEPDRAAGAEWAVVVRDGAGYRLAVDEQRIDRRRVDGLVADAAALLLSDPAQALTLLNDALACWRGEPWAEVADESWMVDEIAIVVELHARVEAMRIDALLALDRVDDAAAAARMLVAARPFDEAALGQLMRALYRSGRQQEALLSFNFARRLLVEEVGVEPGPELQETLAAILDHDPRLGSRLEPGRSSGGRANLALSETPLVARRAELDELAGLVMRSRLVTLVGPGGIGKTRLANELGWHLLDRFDDGVWFVDLDPLGTGGDVAGEVARTLALSDGDRTGRIDPMDPVCRFVAERRLLVILDNCERLVDATARVAARLATAGDGVHVLCTSRRVLDIVGEHVMSLDPLGVPPPGASRDELIASPAARLFLLRAGEGELDLADTATLDAVTGVVRALEGVPLALELAASRVRVMPLQELSDAMADRFSVLVSASGSPSQRHIALRASFDISYALLDQAEQECFDRFGLLNGPVTAEFLGAPGDADRNEATLLLDRLVASSLVTRVETSGKPGYRLLDTTRAYARLHLEESGGVDAAAEWFARRALQFAERTRMSLRGPTQRDELAALDGNYSAMRALVELLVETGRPDLARPIAAALSSYWFLRHHRGEGARIIATMRAGVDTSTDPLGGARLVIAEAECRRGKDNALGSLRSELRDALDVFMANNCGEEVAVCTGLLLAEAAWRGDLDELCRIRELTREAVRGVSTSWHDAINEFFQAIESALSGDIERSTSEFEAVRSQFIDIGDRSWAAGVSYYLGLVYLALGDHDGYRTNIMTAVELSELAGGCGRDGKLSLALADAAIEGGDPRAEWMLLRASDVLERQGDVIGVAMCRRELGALAIAVGNDDRALEMFGRSLPVLAELEPQALALGLAQMLPLISRMRAPENIDEIMAGIRAIESAFAGYGPPDVRRLRKITHDWPTSASAVGTSDTGRLLDLAFGENQPSPYH